MKRQVPSLFSSAPAPADQKKGNKKTKKEAYSSSSSISSSRPPGRGGFIGRAFRACVRRRPGGSRGRGLQVASDERLGPADCDGPPTATAEMEKQWLVEGDSSDGSLDPEGWGLVRAAAPPAHYA